MNDTTQLSPARTEPKPTSTKAGAARFWALLPALLLIGLIGTQMVVLACVMDDPAHAVEPHYYQKALDWDQRRSEQAASAKLGWSSTAHLEHLPRGGGKLYVRLRDASGAPVGGAELEIVAFANARASVMHRPTSVESQPGEYVAHLPSARLGLWEVRVQALHRRGTYVATLRTEMKPAPEGAP